MDTALDDIAFLANSENRVAVFENLVEAPRSRHELRDQVDASRVTIARVLRELEERSWIENAGREYEVTLLGEWVCDEFTDLVDEMKAERRLREPLQWLPSDVMTFDPSVSAMPKSFSSTGVTRPRSSGGSSSFIAPASGSGVSHERSPRCLSRTSGS